MTDLNTGSLAVWVTESIEDIPSEINSGTHIQDLVERGLFTVQNHTGATISTAVVPDKYKNILTNLGCAYTLSQMAGTGLDFDGKIGEFQVRKGGVKGNSNSERADWYISQVNEDLKNIGRKSGNRFKKVQG